MRSFSNPDSEKEKGKDTFETEKVETSYGEVYKTTFPYLDWRIDPSHLDFNEDTPKLKKHYNEYFLGDSQDSHEEYLCHKDIGEGIFGVVRLAQNKKTGKWIAIKKLDRKKIKTLTAKKNLDGEIHTLRAFNNLVFYDPDECIIGMELLKGHELFILSTTTFSHSLSLLQKLVIAKNIFKEMAYLHHDVEHIRGKREKQSTAHRDIKPENIYFNPSTGEVAFCDFGMGVCLKEAYTPLLKGDAKPTLGSIRGRKQGTSGHMAPEILNPKGYDLRLMSDPGRYYRRIYIPQEFENELEKELPTKGLEYEVIGEDGILIRDSIPWSELPNFPKMGSKIIQSQRKTLPILKKCLLKKGHINPDDLSVEYNEATEVYALGVTLARIFNLYIGKRDDFYILKEKKPNDIPKALYELISSMLATKPEDRPTVVEGARKLNQIFSEVGQSNSLNVCILSINDFLKLGESQRSVLISNLIYYEMNAIVLQGFDGTSVEDYYKVRYELINGNLINVADFMVKSNVPKAIIQTVKDHYDHCLGTLNTKIFQYNAYNQKIEETNERSDSGFFKRNPWLKDVLIGAGIGLAVVGTIAMMIVLWEIPVVLGIGAAVGAAFGCVAAFSIFAGCVGAITRRIFDNNIEQASENASKIDTTPNPHTEDNQKDPKKVVPFQGKKSALSQHSFVNISQSIYTKNTEEVMFLKTNRAFFIEQIENNKNFDFVIWAMTNIDEKNLTEDLTNLYKNIISNQEQISQQFRDAIQDEHENSINELLEKNKALCSVLKYLNPSTVNEPKCKMGSSL